MTSLGCNKPTGHSDFWYRHFKNEKIYLTAAYCREPCKRASAERHPCTAGQRCLLILELVSLFIEKINLYKFGNV